ncbi:MAG: type II toxin-antitoxin system RatA family toxin [Paracoccaceae bacterium]|nr:type II toxin-antitoxin system RatA family toxin [Paracoccaceae bacterium]
MKRHVESCIIHSEIKEVFDLVADIESYPKFLPWCVGATITEKICIQGDIRLKADVTIAFGTFREKFHCNIVLDERNLRIEIFSSDRPFKILHGKWNFLQMDEGCQVSFEIEFEFRSIILDKLIGLVFYQAIKKVVTAFKKRMMHIKSD